MHIADKHQMISKITIKRKDHKEKKFFGKRMKRMMSPGLINKTIFTFDPKELHHPAKSRMKSPLVHNHKGKQLHT